jgi:selenium metabolism protein YedF
MKEIDCRGKACPQPVIITKQAMEESAEEGLTIIVDNPGSCENVERFVRSQGGTAKVEKKGDDFYVRIQKPAQCREAERIIEREKGDRIVVYINSNLLGVGEETLGSVLMRAFLKTLLEMEKKPHRLILINSGVRLATEGSEVLDSLKGLSEKGVEILSCGTCLDFYGLKEKLKVGIVSNMFEIAQSLLGADRLIRP